MPGVSRAPRAGKSARALALSLVALGLGSCAHQPTEPVAVEVVPKPATAQPRPSVSETLLGGPAERAREELKTRMYPGTGKMVQPPPARKEQKAAAGEVVLNFENADLREVIKVILGDMLGENFVIDPQVKGAVTVQTSRPLSKESLLPTLESVLRMNGAALLRLPQGGYQIKPLAAALQGTVTPQLASVPTNLPPGYDVQIVPLKFVSVHDMQKLLEPFAPPGSITRTDEVRNMLILAGTRDELAHLLDTIQIFDVDWLAGMSVGIFPLQAVDAKTVNDELEKVFGEKGQGPLAGLVRIIPIDRLNALLVVTTQPRYLEEARNWIERLDRGAGGTTARIYVYHVQNGKAEHLAEVLGELFGGGEKRGRGVGGPQLAPGLAPGAIGSAGPLGTSYRPFPGGSSPIPPATPSPVPAPGTGQFTSTSPTFSTSGTQSTMGGTLGGGLGGGTASRLGGGGLGGGPGGAGGTAAGATLNLGGTEARIIADKDNNALVILATPGDYEKIEAALRKLDVIPRQVLIEASVVEVTLDDSLQYGIEWFFSHNIGKYKGLGDLNVLSTPLVPNATSGININSLTGVPSGFSYALADRAGLVHVLLNELAAKGLTNVLSSPQLMVLDNQTANIKVGAQIPVPTGSAVTTGGVAETSIQYRDTGVLLEVTPRVNAGGLVTLDISQEVTDPGTSITVGNSNSATTFNQRSIKTTVAVQSGQTLVLGGLITENKGKSKSGVPILYDMPIIGPLFGTTSTNDTRRELLIIITPRVVRDQNEARQVTEELKERMRGIREPLDALRRGVIAPR